MKYIIYARKSTEEDDRQILSIEAQLVELREFAAKEKLEIVASFEEAKTAKEPGRVKFAEMLLLIEKGKAEGIISWHPDRLARNSVDAKKEQLLSRKVEVNEKIKDFTDKGLSWLEPYFTKPRILICPQITIRTGRRAVCGGFCKLAIS